MYDARKKKRKTKDKEISGSNSIKLAVFFLSFFFIHVKSDDLDRLVFFRAAENQATKP
jgi:hypothetical protein